MFSHLSGRSSKLMMRTASIVDQKAFMICIILRGVDGGVKYKAL